MDTQFNPKLRKVTAPSKFGLPLFWPGPPLNYFFEFSPLGQTTPFMQYFLSHPPIRAFLMPLTLTQFT